MTAKEVMSYLKISRQTLYRWVYQRRIIAAFHKNSVAAGRSKSGRRKPANLLFDRNQVENIAKPVIPNSERAVKRAAKKLQRQS
jgi:predicted site-specific integrase-resolvase